MCLIVFAINSHPDYPLVLLANRDEFYARPTRNAQFWPDAPHLLAGQDLQAGGTWLGITKQGRIAAITNFREQAQGVENPLSRGKLTKDFLLGKHCAPDYLEMLQANHHHYAGFNLLVGDQNGLWYFSNRSANLQAEKVRPGVHGLSNALLNAAWPKVSNSKQQLLTVLQHDSLDTTKLLAILNNDQIAADEDLPDTGVGLELERMLSPRFIKSADYGTRASSCLLIDTQGQVSFTEQVFNEQGQSMSQADFNFVIETL